MSQDKIKFQFNKSEVKALFDMLTVANFEMIEDPVKRILVRYILEKVYFKLAKRLARKFEETSMSLNQAECLSLYEMLSALDDLDLPDYERHFKYKITDEIHARFIA